MGMRSYLHGFVTPGALRPGAIFLTSILAMAAIFCVDLADGSEIWSQVFYLFPICAIAFSCERLTWVMVGVLLSVVLQLLTFLAYTISAPSVIANWLITLAASAMTVGLARVARSRFARIETLATTDDLTGLHNRRGLESLAEREIARQKRHGGAFSLAVVDLDRFKELNDSKGHEVGDRALRYLGNVLRESTRHSDSIARLGGDEFTILMPNTQETDCAALCQQLSAAIARQMKDAGFAITASIGYTTCNDAPDSVATAIQKADEAMYAAKAMRTSRASPRRVAACQSSPPLHGPERRVVRTDQAQVST